MKKIGREISRPLGRIFTPVILAGGNMSVNGQQACFGEFSTFDHEGYFKMILLSPKHAKTCPYKGKKAFFGDFSTVDQVGYRKWLF